jgi:hypothetical protein
MNDSITNTPAMAALTEQVADLFVDMVTVPNDFAASSQKFNASNDLMEAIHVLVAEFQAKVENGDYYAQSVASNPRIG